MKRTFTHIDHVKAAKKWQMPTVDPVVYDTAIVGCLNNSDNTPSFPHIFDWLVTQQDSDGTWGSRYWHAYDRLVNTLAAIRCLYQAQIASDTIERAVTQIPNLLARLKDDDHETVAFELIAPALLDWCYHRGLPVPLDTLPDERHRRIQRLKSRTLHTSIFSLESLDDIPLETAHWVSTYGSMFASPSAAAGYLMQDPDHLVLRKHLTWLASLNKGGIPAVHPLHTFNAAWQCWYLDLVGQGYSRKAQNLRNQVIRSWTTKGASFSDDFPIVDADDTALSFVIQSNGGKKLDINVFAPYMTSDGARCFPHEFNPSVSANIHILLALRTVAPSAQRDTWISVVLQFLKKILLQQSNGLLTDKWHVSPFYATSRAIIATHELDTTLCQKLTQTLLEHQRVDGSWGYKEGTAEETSYALLALCLTTPTLNWQSISSGATALKRLYYQPWPAQWIGKSLYLPHQVVASAIYAAQQLAENIQHKQLSIYV
ncbi:MAG: hypothetical protein GFH27_549357n24 [Chloroflexi bacterium AL-W]|nr:hypothetical protein [Chloroflexi bacterium AL-N1]NOK70661.1 hypothetical protein [Chloroflexi bacterium AL-N10]NOK78480.1 hypothetical protein [Chloroflexi bacterium AL-N5]NOK85564.1 hypothetical protein [Chloroflexi bacterium AL-W]NOK92478.1 hypothetical protein [Chloroflexi bacterium AL-N15]